MKFIRLLSVHRTNRSRNSRIRAAGLLLLFWAVCFGVNAQNETVTFVNRYRNTTLGLTNGVPNATASATDVWIVEPVGVEQFIRLKHATTGHYLHTEAGPLQAGPLGKPDWWSAQWKFFVVGDYVQIVNRYRNVFIHNENGPLEAGPLFKDDWWSAQWKKTVAPAPAPTVGSVTFANSMSNLANIDVYKDNETASPTFIKRLTYSGTLKIDSVRLGDVFSFKVVNENTVIDPHIITDFGYTHMLKANIRYGSSKAMKINTKANEYSFDIFKIDPIFIDYTADQPIKDKKDGKTIGYGGMRKQIFKSLTENDTHWSSYAGETGDIGLKDQFRKEAVNEGDDRSSTQSCYSDQSFKESYTGNIGVSGGNEKAGKAGGSASFAYTTENSSSKQNIYTYSRSFHTVHNVVLDKSAFYDLTDEFKRAVIALPETNGPAYVKFITDWGTHYATRVGYGGLMIGVITVDEKTFMSSKGWSIDLKGEVEKQAKLEAGFGYSQNQTFNDINSKSTSLHYYKGGTGGSGNQWSISQGTAQPLRIDLSRLPDLLEARFFNNSITKAQLARRKNLLELAITDYIGAPYDAGEILKPRLFRMSNVRWIMKEEKDGLERPSIWGYVKIGLNDNSPEPNDKPLTPHELERLRRKLPVRTVRRKVDQSRELTVFSRSKEPKSSVWAAKNYEEKMDGEITFLVPRASEDLSRYFTFTLLAQLVDHDNNGSDGMIGNEKKTIVLSTIQPGKQTITMNFISDHGDIDVMADVEEITLR